MSKESSPSPDESADKRRSANQVNSSFSSGPKTPEGKYASSQNSLKFGFFSKKTLIPGESWEEFLSFHDTLHRQLGPRNPIEEHIVAKYIGGEWRLKRLPEIEVEIFARYGISEQGNQCGAAFALVNSVQTDNIINQLARYEATLHKYSLKYLALLRTFRKEGWGGDGTTIVEAQVVGTTPTTGNAGGTPSGAVSKDQQSDPSPVSGPLFP